MNARKENGGSQPPKKRIAEKKENRMMWPYSARKNNAKVIAEYSTLKPETNSDSPSVKSKGALLVSANPETKNIRKAGKRGKMNQISDCASTIPLIFSSPTQRITERIMIPILTS